ncbi:serine hydrolase [Georgenia subflava]|uniref:Serine hydrolase n=2 Tax=Georgenia subflava TaxID=1622177 RepID=A0A6N7EUN7_9MICO|nr:serine hydrolase [Georgenia subflava]
MDTSIDTAAVAAALTTAAERDHLSGAVHIARGPDVLFAGAYGVASRRWQVPVHAGTRFDVASVTKLFTSVAVLQQVEAGTLDLDDPVTSRVDLTGTTVPATVTLRHLLTHTSGLSDDADEEAGESYEALWADRPNYAVTETADLLPGFAHKPPRVEPGTDCRYCNAGYILAGLALEAVTGTPYREHVTEHVFARAGMTSSGFFDMRSAVPDVAEGWEPVTGEGGEVTGWTQNIYSYPPIGSPDGGAHCTAADLVRFIDAVRGGELLGPELTSAFLTPQVLHDADDDRELHYGYGLEFVVEPGGALRCYDKDGINTGASAIVRHYVRPGITVAIVANSADAVWDPFSAIDDAVTA